MVCRSCCDGAHEKCLGKEKSYTYCDCQHREGENWREETS